MSDRNNPQVLKHSGTAVGMDHSIFFIDVNQANKIYTSGDHTRLGLAKGVNTWDDWHLIPSSRPEIVPPEVYTNFVDLPGGHGKIDLSEYLTGGPVYKNRTGSLEFYAANGYGFWQERYNQICNFLHGRRMLMVLDDEPEYFYEGRLKVQKWESDGQTNWSTVVIDYELNPFKFLLPRDSLDQYWDRFLFEDVHFYKYINKINSGSNPSINITGYTNGFMVDGFIDDDGPFPADITITVGLPGPSSHSLRLYRASKNTNTVRTGFIDPLQTSSDVIYISGSGIVNLFCWGGHI